MAEESDEVQRAITELGASATRHPTLTATVVLKELRARYGSPGARGLLWEGLADPISHQDPVGASCIGSLVGPASCLLTFEPRDDEAVFMFRDGSELEAVLEDTFGFEFYVTNAEYRFLLCHNHHDFLIAAGSAAAPLQEALERRARALEALTLGRQPDRDTRVWQLIDAYIAAAENAARRLREHFGESHLLRGKVQGRFPARGTFPGVSYAFHGPGCRVTIDGVAVDFDFGPDERADGFDPWRLKQFARSNLAFLDVSDVAIDAVLEAAIASGRIVTPHSGFGSHLLFLAGR